MSPLWNFDRLTIHHMVCTCCNIWMFLSFVSLFECYFGLFLEAEGTAAEVLSQMNIQGDQLKGADKNVWKLRESLEKSKQQLDDLIVKLRKKKLRLQIIAGILATIDLILFYRLFVCGGTFFCRGYWWHLLTMLVSTFQVRFVAL